MANLSKITDMKFKALLYFFIVFFVFFLQINAGAEEDSGQKNLKKRIMDIEKRIQELNKKTPETEDKKKFISGENQYEKLLSAAGKNYSLRPSGIFGLDYIFEYKGHSHNQIQQAEESGTHFEKKPVHTLINKFSIEYPVKDNISFVMDMPFVKIHDNYQGKKIDMEDFGDPYMCLLYQPFMKSSKFPEIIISAGVTFPMGRSPYDINPQTEFPTGDGVYKFNLGLNLSRQIDPVLVFGGFFYSYKLNKKNLSYKNTVFLGEAGEFLKKVKPGDEAGFNAGLGYVISENVSISLGLKFLYNFPSEYYWRGRGKRVSSSASESTLFMGTSWQITEKRKIYMALGAGLTNNDDNLNFTLRIPFNFIL
ncbi:MAG: hypothetical protein CSA18_04330 [Deltaproteobacteria bacterium]|nr:MAG: hypothetical protein CSA18_04330 [Deltaproteobacteria bacterium]